ncbi:MAG: hypothetical protein JSS44_03510 [Proteobacteria bacterium]|nr:hypothetical protein [Pseudomonadota bacterium]MBS0465493.1 hypothetical protein [Pseudomonadota bacterium]
MPTDTSHLRGLRPGILGLAVACTLAAAQVGAVGLGGIEVKSKLNEPFVAEIPLNVDYSGQMSDMVVHMASPEVFERVGLKRPNDMSANLAFKVTRNARGEAVVLVTTPQKMTDPYVSFLLEVEWGSGKMVREYTAMLEPPHVAEVPHAAAVAAPTVASTPMPIPAVTAPKVAAVEREPQATPASTPAPVASTPSASVPSADSAPPAPPAAQTVAPEPAVPEPEATPQPVASAPAPEPAPPEPAPTAPEPTPAPIASAPPPPPPTPAPGSITVGNGQTLSGIAAQVGGGQSLNRVMIALQRANPDAFVDNNINRLKSGAVLRVPDADALRAITADEANALVREQVESWRHGTVVAPQLQPGEAADHKAAKLEASGDTPAAQAGTAAIKPARGRTNPGKGTAQAGDPPPHAARLQILPPVGNAGGGSQSGSAAGGAGSEVRAELAQTKEELASRKAQIADLKAHVADLEKIKADSQKMLSLKDSQMAALQQRLAELEKKDAEAAASTASSPASTASGIAAPIAASPAAIATAPAASASAAASSANTSSPAKAPAPHVAPPPREPASPWYLQPFVLLGAGLILFAGLLGVMLKRPKVEAPPPRKRSFDVGALAAGMPASRNHRQAPMVAESLPEDVDAAAKVTAELPLSETAPGQTGDLADDAAHAPPAEPRATSVEPVFVPPQVRSAPTPAEPAQEPARAAADPQITSEQPVFFAPNPPPATTPAPAAPAPLPQTSGNVQWTAQTRIEAARNYIENGDIDSARRMLEVALIDGNASQQEEAFTLLDMIDSW